MTGTSRTPEGALQGVTVLATASSCNRERRRALHPPPGGSAGVWGPWLHPAGVGAPKAAPRGGWGPPGWRARARPPPATVPFAACHRRRRLSWCLRVLHAEQHPAWRSPASAYEVTARGLGQLLVRWTKQNPSQRETI